ncbi:uncharacterized protein LOC116262307 [Nymphaea colorata]|nr:uncharacterized protein LOC116262307 [Nymphaea colorata]
MLTRWFPASLLLFSPKVSVSSSSFIQRSSRCLACPVRKRRGIHFSRVLAMAEGSQKHKHVNRLASEHSPYLLQHAHNPVDWFPWGQEAFDRARERNIPIFLSIGYSTCHWCHVMEVESFENEEVAEMLNQWFISIKVDREERPDVDKVYMTYVQAVYGSGGWPLSVFLSPDLKPLMGGTYFPPDDKYGRPGFKTVLRRVKEAWETKQDMLKKSADFAIQELSEALSAAAINKVFQEDLSYHCIDRCASKLKQSYDSDFGGFGAAPKFPRPVEINVMLYYAKLLEESLKKTEAKNILNMTVFSLKCMAKGGIHDHVGGGFHRYSVDERWHVPHFEKMLYDQGQLANVYLDAFSITNDPFYASMARDVLDYLRRDMIGEEGGIYSAEDADSAEFEGAGRKKEGAFYIWTSKEVEELVGADSMKPFKDHYYIKPTGNCDLSKLSDPHHEFTGKNVLIEKEDASKMAPKFGMAVEEYLNILGSSRQKLFNARLRRPRPHLDDKVIVAWNGLAISSFARASKILKSEIEGTKFYFPVTGCDPEEYMDVAEKAVLFVRHKLYDGNTHRLHHSFRKGPSRAPGFLDDYAFLISGLLDMYEYGGRTRWLAWAIELQATQDNLFLDKAGGGYFNTPGEDPSVLLRVKEDHDGAEPSGNSVAAINLVRLFSLVSGDLSNYYRETAKHLLAVFESRLKEQSVAVPLMCCAAHMLCLPSRKQVVIVGRKSAREFQAMVAEVHASYDPNKTVIQIDPSNTEEMSFWEEKNPNVAMIAKGSPGDKAAAAYVCMNFTCSAPVTAPEALGDLLRGGKSAATGSVI